MNDSVSTEEAEERLRRTFARRAERMATGVASSNGNGAGPDGAALPAGGGPPELPLVPLTPRDGDGLDLGPTPSVGRRLVLAAATVAAVVGIGVAAVVSSQGGEGGDDQVGTGPAEDSGAATTVPDTSPPDTGATDGATPGPEAPEGDCPTTTTSVPPPPGYVPPPEGAEIPTRQDRDIIGAYTGGYIPDVGPIELTLERQDFFPFDGGGMPGIEPIQAGENHGWMIPMPGSDGQLMAARLEFGDQLVMIIGLRVDRQLVLDVAASVRREGDTFTFTPPAGLTEVCL